MAVILALPLILIVSSPVFHSAGIKEFYSATDNISGPTTSQRSAMGSMAASGPAGWRQADSRKIRSLNV